MLCDFSLRAEQYRAYTPHHEPHLKQPRSQKERPWERACTLTGCVLPVHC